MKDDKQEINEEFLKEELGKIDKEDVDAALRKEKEISKKMDDAKTLSKYAEMGKSMFSLLRDYKNGAYTATPWMTIAAIAGSLLYVFNPFDIIPDFIPGLGYLDDLAVFTYAIKFVETDLHQYLDWKLKDNEQKLQKD